MNKQNILLVINPVSGRRKIKPLLYKIIDMLCKNGCKTTIFITSQRGDAISIVKDNAIGFQKIICCGGDGTLNEVFTGLNIINAQIPVGYIPTGTTNDFANTLKLPRRFVKAAMVALHGESRSLDLGSFNEGKFFTYVASFGVFTNVAYKTPQWLKNSIGRISYYLYGASILRETRAHTVKITADNKELSGDFIFGSVTNTTVLGGFFRFLQDDVCLDDGFFEVLLIRAPKTPKDLQIIFDSILKRRYNDDRVLLFKAKSLKFSFAEAVPWTVDGEFAGEVDCARIENLHKTARIIV